MKYPDGTKVKITNKITNHAHRGMGFEDDINLTNQYYKDHNIALIYKKPTPIKATNISYKNNTKQICNGYFEKASTTDYNGIYKGFYIDFEAKVTTSKTSFPINNIHQHQLEHLLEVTKHQGISFILVNFCDLNQIFLLETDKIFDIMNTRKSIPVEYFMEKGYLIKENYQPRIDYIKIIDEIIRRKYENKV